MSEKNWREWIFIINMIAAILVCILLSIAPLIYPGFSLNDSYGNPASKMLHILIMCVWGISSILFAIAIGKFFVETTLEKWLSIIGSILMILEGISAVVLGFSITMHLLVIYYLFLLIWLLTGMVSAILYSIAMFHNKEYPNGYGVVFLVILVISIIFTLTTPATMPVEMEWILVYTYQACNFILSYGAWKQIKS